MSSDSFSISHTSPQVVLYDEGQGRTIEFKCRDGNDMTVISVPAADVWTYHTPSWAHEQRPIILQRVRDSGLIVYEASQLLLSVLSPDGTFRVETQSEPDDRAPDWETLQIINTADNRVILRLPLYSFTDNVQFAGPDVAVISLQGRYGERHRLRVDVRRETFQLDDDPTQQSAAQLSARLFNKAPSPILAYSSIRATRRPPWLGDLASAIIGSIFVAGGIWMCFGGKTTKDRLIGGLCVLFFGAIAAACIRSLMRIRRRRRQ